MKFKKKTRGAISIFLVIILVPMMTVSALFVDASKVKLAKGVAESAGDLTMNSALTDYDTMLKDMYGLFATAQDTDDLYAMLEDYYRTCITSSGVGSEDADAYVDQIIAQLELIPEDDETADILNMELIDFDVSKRSDATLANATVLEKQIVDFMKYRAPINTGLSFLTSLKSFSTLSAQTELVDKRKEYYEEQQTVMESAQKAWEGINKYNGTNIIKVNNYLEDMDTNFGEYQDDYLGLAKIIIMDKYEAQSYGNFSSCGYTFVDEDIKIDEKSQGKIPVLYVYGSRIDTYNQYTTYSEKKETTEEEKEGTEEENKASAEEVNSAISSYENAKMALETAHDNLLAFDDKTYGPQYLIQTRRNKLYKTWTDKMLDLNVRYNELRHAMFYAEGGSITCDKISDFSLQVSSFKNELVKCDADLNNCLSKTDTDLTTTKKKISDNFDTITEYRATVSTAKENLEYAVENLEDVYEAVKIGGVLDDKEGAWKAVAAAEELSNTSMAKQDLAEIESLSTYLDDKAVGALLERLNNIIGNLEEMLVQIDSYTFFGKKITEIKDYEYLKGMLKDNIGDNELKNVPLNKAELETQIKSWCNGKFVIGKKIDVSWGNDTGTQANLSGPDKLKFYTFLYSHFNTGDEPLETELKKADTENGEDFYHNIESTSAGATTSMAGEDEAEVVESGDLKDKENKPSDNIGNDSEAAAMENINTGDAATADTSKSLSSMFKDLSKAALDLGTDIRDKLYVSDYVMSMFTYDTIENEYKVNNSGSGETVELQSITLTPMDADHNFSYGKEVEYIIYGGTNTENITKAYASIYGIRFGFNVIYAFMDSQIRETAFAMATPISAATLGVIPVPLIQAAIIIGIACCESAFDLNDLRQGKSVPLFKTKETWYCSMDGLLNTAKELAGEAITKAADYAVDKSIAKLSEVIDMTDEELDNYIDTAEGELEQNIGYAYDTMITRHADVAIQKLTILATNALEEQLLEPTMDMEAYVSEGLDAWLASELAGSDSSDIGYLVKKEAVAIIKVNYIPMMLDALQSSKENVSDQIEKMGSEITDLIDQVRRDINSQVLIECAKVKEYKSDMLDSINTSMNDGGQKLKETINGQIDGVFGSSSVKGTDNTGMSSLLSFSYSDYMRLFLMIGLVANEEGVLLRTADVIQANMSMASGEEDYLLSNAAVYVEIEATVQVKPTLLAIPFFTEVEGNPSTDERWYTFNYNSIKGY